MRNHKRVDWWLFLGVGSEAVPTQAMLLGLALLATGLALENDRSILLAGAALFLVGGLLFWLTKDRPRSG